MRVKKIRVVHKRVLCTYLRKRAVLKRGPKRLNFKRVMYRRLRQFGMAVSLSGNTLAVGANAEDTIRGVMRVRRTYGNDRERHGPRLRRFIPNERYHH